MAPSGATGEAIPAYPELPFPRRMGQRGGKIDDTGPVVDGGGLQSCDLKLAQGLAHDLKPAR